MSVTSLPDKLQALRSELKAFFLERDRVIDGLLAAVLSRQHILLLGPPGTGKSQKAAAICSSITGAQLFSQLLTRFTEPEELFGPFSLKAMKEEDEYRRKVDGKLPEAHLVVLDEIWKASSSILNSMLRIANERIFKNGDQVVDCPLMTLIGASNELPEDDELSALDDRFLFRFNLRYLQQKANKKELLLRAHGWASGTQLTLEELNELQEGARAVDFPESVIDSLLKVEAKLKEEGVVIGDRRRLAVREGLKAYAFVTGASTVEVDHFEILPDMLWKDPKDRPKIAEVIGEVSNPITLRAIQLQDAAFELAASVPSPQGINSNAITQYREKAEAVGEKLEQAIQDLKDMIGSVDNPKRAERAEGALAKVKGYLLELREKQAESYSL